MHSQISPYPGMFCLLGQKGLTLEQPWEVNTHHRRCLWIWQCKPTGIATQLLLVLPNPDRAQPLSMGRQQQG